jgi:hypothetical protein
MTGPEHYAEAERLAAEADEWLNADHGWKAHLSSGERLARRNSDIAAAQVHAILGLTAVVAADSVMRRADRREWDQVTGYEPDAPEAVR